MNCHDAFCHPEFISGSIQGGSLQFNAYKMLKQVQHDDGGCKTGLPRKSDDFLAMTNNRNLFRKIHNDQNCLTVMSSRSSINEKSKVKPETKCNQIQNKLWQKQSNRNISTCVAQREVA